MAVGIMETFLSFFLFLPSFQLLGLPPGDRDANLPKIASAESVAYIEWVGRADGEVGAEGVDGLAADPEVIHFFNRVNEIAQNYIASESGIDQLKVIPELVLELLSHPGCLYLEFDATKLVEDGFQNNPMLLAFSGGVIINAGEDADALSKQIAQLASMALRQEIETVEHLTLPTPNPVEIHRHQSYFLIGIGDGAVSEMLERLDAGTGGLNESESFQSAMKSVEAERTASMMFIDAKQTIDHIQVLNNGNPFITTGLQFAGVEDLQWLASSNSVNKEGNLVTQTKFKGVSPDSGIMKAFAGAKVTDKDLAAVPSDSDAVMTYSFDVLPIVDAVVNASPPGSQEMIEQGFFQAGMMVGLDWKKDVFDVFDNTYVISNSPGDGGWLFSSVVLSVGIKDKESAASSVSKFSTALRRTMPEIDENRWRKRGVTMETAEFLGSKIYMINAIGDDDVPLAPSWCVTDTHLLVGLHPQSLKSRLRRLKAGDFQPIDTMTVTAGEKTFATSFVRTKEVLPDLYGFGQYLAQIIVSEMQSEDIPMTMLDVPSASAILPYMGDSRSRWQVKGDTLEGYREGPPVIGSVSTSLPVATPAFFFSMLSVQRARVVRAEAVLEAAPALEAADAAAE